MPSLLRAATKSGRTALMGRPIALSGHCLLLFGAARSWCASHLSVDHLSRP